MAQKRQRVSASKEAKPSQKEDTKKAPVKSTPAPEVAELEEQLADVSDSDLDDDDEFAAAHEESSGSDNSDDEDGDSSESADELEDDSFPLKKKKKTADDGRGTFANAFNAILGSKLKAHDRKDPILVRNKSTLKKMESDKLEAKAKRAIHSEKKDLEDKFRVTNLLPSALDSENAREIIEKERRLKKVAQKGVVKLFNAVLATQVRTTQDVGQEKVGQTKKEELMNELTKSKFLDLVKAAGDE